MKLYSMSYNVVWSQNTVSFRIAVLKTLYQVFFVGNLHCVL